MFVHLHYPIREGHAYFAQNDAGIIWKGLHCTLNVACPTDSQILSCRIRLMANIGRDVPAVHFLLWFFDLFSRPLHGYWILMYIYTNPSAIWLVMSTLFFSFSCYICWCYRWKFNKIFEEKGMLIMTYTRITYVYICCYTPLLQNKNEDPSKKLNTQ